jgi:hypothetical protein
MTVLGLEYEGPPIRIGDIRTIAGTYGIEATKKSYMDHEAQDRKDMRLQKYDADRINRVIKEGLIFTTEKPAKVKVLGIEGDGSSEVVHFVILDGSYAGKNGWVLDEPMILRP